MHMNANETLLMTARRRFRDFAADQHGAAAIEYAMIASGVAVALAATITSIGSSVRTTLYDKLASIFQ